MDSLTLQQLHTHINPSIGGQIFNWGQFWSILGVIVSVVGLGFAFWQIRKIAKETETISKTYTKAVEEFRANELISNISIALEKTRNIRQGFIINSMTQYSDDIAGLSKKLIVIKGAFPDKAKNLDKYIGFTSELFIAYAIDKDLFAPDVKPDYVTLIMEIENYLSEMEGEVKFKQKVTVI